LRLGRLGVVFVFVSMSSYFEDKVKTPLRNQYTELKIVCVFFDFFCGGLDLAQLKSILVADQFALRGVV
jgi:hypothetical protein